MRITINYIKRNLFTKNYKNLAFVKRYKLENRGEVILLLRSFKKVFNEEVEHNLHIRDYEPVNEFKKYKAIIIRLKELYPTDSKNPSVLKKLPHPQNTKTKNL